MDPTIDLPDGTPWIIAQGQEKLALRATLPGAFVFDHAAAALAEAQRAGVGVPSRVTLAFASSWLVNSPATSRVLRRWREDAAMGHWVALVEELESSTECRWDEVQRHTSSLLVPEVDAIESISKVLALVVPNAVPLLPPKARAFLRKVADPKAPGAVVSTFVETLQWFAQAWRDHVGELRVSESLTPAQVLDRWIWFDSDGHAHWP